MAVEQEISAAVQGVGAQSGEQPDFILDHSPPAQLGHKFQPVRLCSSFPQDVAGRDQVHRIQPVGIDLHLVQYFSLRIAEDEPQGVPRQDVRKLCLDFEDPRPGDPGTAAAKRRPVFFMHPEVTAGCYQQADVRMAAASSGFQTVAPRTQMF